MKTLETERLLLRDWRKHDAADLFEYAKSPNVGPNAGWKPHDDINESIEIIEKFIIGQDCWAVELKDSKRVIGSVGLHNGSYPGYMTLGYVFGESYWGRGYATEASQRVLECAFDAGYGIVSVAHYPHNARSKRVIEKLGFTYEGTLRKYRKIFNGEVYDLACYSMTKEEWDSRNRN